MAKIFQTMREVRPITTARMRKCRKTSITATKIVIVFTTLFVAAALVSVKAEPIFVRDINVNLINCYDAQSSWIYDTDYVRAGVLQAISDAQNRSLSPIIFGDQENIYFNEITSTEQLMNKIMGGTNVHDIFINAHGEMVPYHISFKQNDGGSEGDSPDNFQNAVTISDATAVTGQLRDWDTVDFYKIFANKNPTLYDDLDWYFFGTNPMIEIKEFSIKMTPALASDFDLYLYGPSGELIDSSTRIGAGLQECVSFRPTEDGYRGIEVRARNIDGSLGFPRVVDPGSYSIQVEIKSYLFTCPFLFTWDGQTWQCDNDISINSLEITEDNYVVQKPMVPFSDGIYGIVVGEWEQEKDMFDQIELIAIDHDEDISVAATRDGRIFTFDKENLIVPLTAIDNNGTDVLPVLSKEGYGNFTGNAGDTLTMNFGRISSTNGVRLMIKADIKKLRPLPSGELCIKVEVNINGRWKHVETIHPREKWYWEPVDISTYASQNEDLLIRLVWTRKHAIDMVAIDTSLQQPYEIIEGALVSAEHREYGRHKKYRDVTQTLREKDESVVTLQPPGGFIQMNFTLPPLTRAKRDFLIKSFGNYRTVPESSLPTLLSIESTTTLSTYTSQSLTFQCPQLWQTQYITTLGDLCTKKGAIWANVAGYTNYYLSNTGSGGGMYTVGEDGLKTFTQRNITCHYYDDPCHTASYDMDFSESKIMDEFPLLPTTVKTGRPIKGLEPLWQLVGYTDDEDGNDSVVTCGVVLADEQGVSPPGIYIHSGLSVNQGSPLYSDFVKGYVATAVAIEEARSILFDPIPWVEYPYGDPFAAAYCIYRRPGYWGHGYDTIDGRRYDYRYVDLVFVTRAHYQPHVEITGVPPLPWWIYLSVGGVEAWGTPLDLETRLGVGFEIDPLESGLEIEGDTNRELMDRLGWWGVGLVASAIGWYAGVPFLGSVTGIIPILQAAFNPESWDYKGSYVYAIGFGIDGGGGDGWGTSLTYIKLKFYGYKGLGPTTYQFNFTMKNWIGAALGLDVYNYHYYQGITGWLSFTHYW